jgi:hypothetical protein
MAAVGKIPVQVEVIFTDGTLGTPRREALENLEAEVGHYLRRNPAPELREAYIASREAAV